MATNTAGKAGNWSDTTVWSLGHAPIDGEDVALGTYIIVWDTAQTVIPATGSLATISASAEGQITLALDDAAFHGGATITFTTAVAPALANTGLITVTGTTDHVLNINCTSVTAAGSGDYGVYWNTTGTLNFTGNLIGGSNASGYGLYIAGAGNVNITGNLTGETGPGVFLNAAATVNVYNSTITGGLSGTVSGYGIHHYSNTGTITLNSTGTGCNLVNSVTSFALGGNGCVWNALATNYIQFGATKYAPEVAAADLKSGVKNGTVTGTLVSGASGGSIAIF